MQKLSLLPLLLITGIGAVWASTLMFPNTTEFPRSPGGAGTISGALAFFDPTDGTATNTDKLNGVTASGYLQNRDCSTEVINKIWVGVDASGRAICGTRGVLIGYLTEGSSVSITRGASPSTTISVGDLLYAGDIIQTNAGTGTIRFAADESILRLDTSTVVELSVGTLGSNSVAQAILSDGRLWGRILTSTGVNLGGGGLVAGVRGTSVSIERPGTTGPYVISVIDSVNHGTTIDTAAATLSPILGYNVGGLSPGSILTAGSQLSVNMIDTAGTMSYSSVIPASPSTTKTSLLTNSAWIRDNTRADIDYLYIHSGSAQRIVDEYNATVPRSIDTLISDALCPELAGATPTVKRLYWISLIPYAKYLDKCRENTLLAFADYTGSTSPAISTLGFASPMIYSGGTIGAGGTGSITLEGYSITATGQYISYATGEFDRIGGLAGKTITIELGGAVGSNLPTTWTKAYIADFGTEQYFVVKSGQSCNGIITVDTLCKKVGTTSTRLTLSTASIVSITLSTTPTQMIIGNIGVAGNTQYDRPIGMTIKNIRIQ